MRHLSVTSLLATLITATLLILLYRHDQLAEHEGIAAEENEKTAIHLIQLMGGQINSFVMAAEGLDIRAFKENPSIVSLNTTLRTVREHHILKLKLFNPAGTAVFSSAADEIGSSSKHPEMLAKALQGETLHQIKFYEKFRSSGGELHDRYVTQTFKPLNHAGTNIGVLEIYADATPVMDRIRIKIVNIALIVLGAFAALYAALFFSARKADLAIAEDNRKLAENEAQLRTTIDTAMDAIISIDASSLLIGFNPAAEAIFGWRHEEAIGQSMSELIIPERHRAYHQKGIARYLQTGESHILGNRIETTALRRDGTEFPIELAISPISESGHITFTAYIRDITERVRSEEELHESRAFHQSVTEAMGEIGIGLFIVDADFRVRFMNDTMKNWFGNQIGQICYLSVGGANEQCAYCQLDRTVQTQCQIDHIVQQKRVTRYSPVMPDGRAFDIIATPFMNRDGTISNLEVFHNVTEIRKAEQELRIAAKAFESQEGMFITDADGLIQRVNRTFSEVTGYGTEEAVGQNYLIIKSGRHSTEFYQEVRETIERNGHWHGETWNRRKNGEIYPSWEIVTAVPDPDGLVTHYIYVFSDITKRKDAEEQINHLAFFDPLTQLPNRRLLTDRLQQALVTNERNNRQGALLFIDFDNFKNLNDTQGHDTGDLLLVEAANRLHACIRQGDTAARLGGDEFVVLLEDLDPDEPTAASHAESIGEKIRASLGQPYLLKEHEYLSTVSIGATLLRGPVRTTDEMLRRADIGLYQAKADGRNILRFFDPVLQALVTARVAMENDLRHSIYLQQPQFELYYQAQVDSSGRLIGAESLVRWQHPVRGMVSPAEFIHLAEETGLILPLGHWVLTAACRQLASWAARPEMAHLTLAVNVSARQFNLPGFVEEVLSLVDSVGVNPVNLKLEITEGMLLSNVDDIIYKMTSLKAKGINFSLDDFGTGFSSLSYLKRLPLYQLKIDQSFVHDVLTDSNDAAIAITIVALSKSLGLSVIAEGVETEEQRDFLALNGCHAYQGYLFSKPIPIFEFEQLATQYA